MKLAETYLSGLKNAYLQRRAGERWDDFAAVVQGANQEDLEKLKSIYPEVPQTLIDLLLLVDGTYWRAYAGTTITFYFLGSDVDDGAYPYYLLSSNQMSEQAEFCADYVNREFDDVQVDDRIIDCADHMRWLNFAHCMNNGGTSQLYLDFTPSAKGIKGQVVRFLHDPDELQVIANSFDEYLRMLMGGSYAFINEISMS